MPWPWGSGQRICQQRSDTQPPALTVKPLNQGVQLKLNASNFGNSSASKCIRVKRARWLVTLCEWGAPRVQTRRFDYKLNVACLNAIVKNHWTGAQCQIEHCGTLSRPSVHRYAVASCCVHSFTRSWLGRFVLYVYFTMPLIVAFSSVARVMLHAARCTMSEVIAIC